MLHPVLEDAISSLLTTWRHYDDLTRRKVAHQARAEARRQLDADRTRVYKLRRGLNPEARELEEVAFSAHCPTLGVPTFLRTSGLLDDDGSFACPCGAVVTGTETEAG